MARWMAIGRCGWPVLVDVGQVEPLGQHHEVDLDRRHLPLAAEGVVDVDVDLGRVERAVLGLDDVVARRSGSSVSWISASARSHSAGSPIALSGLVANANRGTQPDPRVRLVDLAEQRLELVRELVRADVDVRVVLDELADPGQPAQRPGPLVAMQPAVLAVAAAAGRGTSAASSGR